MRVALIVEAENGFIVSPGEESEIAFYEPKDRLQVAPTTDDLVRRIVDHFPGHGPVSGKAESPRIMSDAVQALMRKLAHVASHLEAYESAGYKIRIGQADKTQEALHFSLEEMRNDAIAEAKALGVQL